MSDTFEITDTQGNQHVICIELTHALVRLLERGNPFRITVRNSINEILVTHAYVQTDIQPPLVERD